MRGILFDKDGTLLDFEASWTSFYRELCDELANGDLAEAQRLLIIGGMDPGTGLCRAGSPLAAGNTIDIACTWFPTLAGDALDAMIGRIDAAFLRNGAIGSVAIAGLSETLEALAAAGFAMGVATSDGAGATRAALAALGVAQHLRHVYGYDSVPRPKPAPDMVHAFAAAIGAGATDIVVVGDNTHDLEMARRAGAGAAIGVLSGTGRVEDLAPLADVVLPSIRELPDWLRTRMAGLTSDRTIDPAKSPG
jgi:phosphoglycolate phosphatase